jgi:hypothetical protein
VNNLNNLYIDENDFDDDNFNFVNHLDTNSLSENNNSGLREIVIDNIMKYYRVQHRALNNMKWFKKRP